MRVYALSDLHLSFQTDKPMNVFGEKWEDYEEKVKNNWNRTVTDNDVVIIAGDISWAMQIADTQKDFEFISTLNGIKIIVRGNHDYWWKSISGVREILPPRTYALQNDAIKIDDKIFCGTRGWMVPEEGCKLSESDQKIYNRELIRLEMALTKAKQQQTKGEEIICILHYPPFNSSLNCNEFTNLIESYGVSKVVYGHLHGKTKYSKFNVEINGVKYFLSSCDKTNFEPIVIE